MVEDLRFMVTYAFTHLLANNLLGNSLFAK